MSSTNGTSQQVQDDEGTVDRKTKEQILALRKQVDDDERALYVERMSDPQYNLTIPEANQYWGISVRQYLRGIKRLWNDDTTQPGVENVQTYWAELEIGDERLVPPDQDGYEFSLLARHHEYDDTQLRRALGLPRDADLPQPVTKTFNGLYSVLKTNRIEHTWVVTTDSSGPPPEHETIQLHVAMPVPKHILENAVEAADNFLQQAGLGFDVSAPPYRGGEEPGL